MTIKSSNAQVAVARGKVSLKTKLAFSSGSLEEAILGMLPKNKLHKLLAKRLRVYAGGEHPHEAQNPQALEHL